MKNRVLLPAAAAVLLSLVALLASLTSLTSLGGVAVAAPAAPPSGSPATPAVRSWAGYPFVAGQVCRPDAAHPTTTAPLVSWQLDPAVPPAFLTSPVTESNSTISGAPPLAVVGPQSHGAVVASPNGLPSTAAIAQYAALIQYFGAAGDAATAEVADAVMTAFDSTAAAGVAGCVDQVAAQALLARAADLAGPYTISFVAHAGKVVMGRPDRTGARVTSANGTPVAGAVVHFSAAGAALHGHSQQASVRTDSTGTASVPVLVPPGTTAPSIAITAQVTVDTGLTAVTAQAVPTTVNPTQTVTTAVYHADPVTATGEQQLDVEQSAQPALSVSSSIRSAVVGTTFTPRAGVTGMTGHAGTTTFTTRGPVALVNRTLCSALSAADFSAAPVLASSQAQVLGDRTVRGAPVQPAQPGCYLVTATVATIDAVPAASAQGAAPAPVTVLDTTATIDLDHALIGSTQPVAGAVTVADLHGTSVSVQTEVTGPRPIGYDKTGCQGVDYARAPTTTATTDAAVSTVAGGGDGATARFTAATTGIGCYRVTVALVLHVAGANDIFVAGADSSSVLSIDPSVTMTLTSETPPVQGSTVGFLVEPNATFGQPAHVVVTMVRAADPTGDCSSASYARSAADRSGPAVAVPATEFPTATTRSAALGPAGCYLPDARVPTIGQGEPAGRSTRSVVPAGIGFGFLLGLAVLIVLVTALRSKHVDGAAQ